MAVAAFVAAVLVLTAWAWAFSRKATEARAKASVHQEFSDCFAALAPTYRIKDKTKRERAARKQWMRLALCDPVVRDGLRSALTDADTHWASLGRTFPARTECASPNPVPEHNE